MISTARSICIFSREPNFPSIATGPSIALAQARSTAVTATWEIGNFRMSPGQPGWVIMDIAPESQSATSITAADLAGNYSFSWSGLELVQPAVFDENYVGQYAQTSTTTGNVTGAVDYAQLGLNVIHTNGVTLNAGISGTLTVGGDGTQSNTYKIAIGGPSPFTANFVAYFADGGTVMMVCSDGNRTTTGVASAQTQ